MSELLMFGFGYTGERFCRNRLAAGWRVGAVVRSEDTRNRVREIGATPVDIQDAQQAAADATAILVVAPPTDSGCPGLDALSPMLSKRMRWIAYVSSTAVYGDQQGQWTYEDSPLNAASTTGRRRLAAERAWRARCEPAGLPLVIFRLAGIYGPGRSAFDRLRDGTARRIEKSNHALSRIHVDDIVTLLEASLDGPNQQPIYNVCDDEPAPTSDLVTYAAKLIGVQPPPSEPYESAAISRAAERYFLENRRISNALAKQALDWRPRYPTYREGLTAIFRAENQTHFT